jgi:hypothetical protein
MSSFKTASKVDNGIFPNFRVNAVWFLQQALHTVEMIFTPYFLGEAALAQNGV